MRYQKLEQFLHGYTPLCRIALGRTLRESSKFALKNMPCAGPISGDRFQPGKPAEIENPLDIYGFAS